jgi:nicotinamidase-related amidase
MRSTAVSKALLVIDLQNDYFPGGLFPLWNTEAVLQNIENAIEGAGAKGMPVIHVQHVADSKMGISPFFNGGTTGVEIHPQVLAAAPDAPVIVKHYADSFEQTTLEETLMKLGVTELLVCGMMTQNCVTHTAISKAAEKYAVTVLTDCCTTVSEILHLIALHALSTRVKLLPSTEAI